MPVAAASKSRSCGFQLCGRVPMRSAGRHVLGMPVSERHLLDSQIPDDVLPLAQYEQSGPSQPADQQYLAHHEGSPPSPSLGRTRRRVCFVQQAPAMLIALPGWPRLIRTGHPSGSTVCGSLMVGGWSSNLLDRLGMHYWTAPGSIRGAMDFINIGGYYYNFADFLHHRRHALVPARRRLPGQARGHPPHWCNDTSPQLLARTGADRRTCHDGPRHDRCPWRRTPWQADSACTRRREMVSI
jgi:hypothetical protein